MPRMLMIARVIASLTLILLMTLGVVCYVSRRKPIGGWLLFFCGQISIGTALGLVSALNNYRQYISPDQLGFEPWIALLVVKFAPISTGIACVVAMAALLAEQTWDAVVRLRYVLISHACTAALAILIDLKYFPQAVPQRAGTAIVVGVWIAYFYSSFRVRSVFLTRDWDQLHG